MCSSDSRWDEYWKQYREWYDRYGNFYAEMMQRQQKPPPMYGGGPVLPPGASAELMMRGGGKPRSPYDRPRSPEGKSRPPYDARGHDRGPPRDERDRRPLVDDRYARASARDDTRDRHDDKDPRDRRDERLANRRDDARDRRDDVRLQPENGGGKDSGRISDSRSVRDSAAEAQGSSQSRQPAKRGSDTVITDRGAEGAAEPTMKRVKREDEVKSEQESRRSPSADSKPKLAADSNSQPDSKKADSSVSNSESKRNRQDSKRKSTDSDKHKDKKKSRKSSEEKTEKDHTKISTNEDSVSKKSEVKEKTVAELKQASKVREDSATDNKSEKSSATAVVLDTVKTDSNKPMLSSVSVNATQPADIKPLMADVSQKSDSLLISRPPPSKWETDDYSDSAKRKKDKKKDKREKDKKLPAPK